MRMTAHVAAGLFLCVTLDHSWPYPSLWFVCWVSCACSLLGEKTSRGSKWQLLEAGKKYFQMPVHQGSVPEEVGKLCQGTRVRSLISSSIVLAGGILGIAWSRWE